MAQMIPSDVNHSEFHGSLGEERVYSALKALPEEYIVFHSVHWQKKAQSGRVSWGESDFTIFHPKRGLLVIEVKSGGIKCLDGRWMQTNTLTQQVFQMKDPLVQAERSKFTFVDLLDSSGEAGHPYWVEVAVWFPSVKNKTSLGALPPAYCSSILLTEEDLQSARASIEDAFNHYCMYEKNLYSKDDIVRVIKMLSPNFDAIPNLQYNISEQQLAFNRMTAEQSLILDYLEEQKIAAIQGGAGTGKTMLAIEKAIRLSDNGKVLFLCFNKFLLDYLRENYSVQHPNIDFYNLPSFSISKTGDANAGDNDSITAFLNEYNPNIWPYRHLVIDEGQDFLAEHIALLKTIAEIQKGCFYIFYDRNQLVQQRQTLDWINDLDCRLVLSANCRNTKSIATTSYRPIGINQVKMRTEVIGEKPKLYIEKDGKCANDRIVKIIRQYTDNGIERNDIVILTAKTEDVSMLAGLNSIGPYGIKRNPKENGILFTSARKFKGLEAYVVIMVDVDETTFETEEAKRVFYVGTSRAKHFLEFVSVVDDNQIHLMTERLIGRKAKNAKLMLGSQLKVKLVVETES